MPPSVQCVSLSSIEIIRAACLMSSDVMIRDSFLPWLWLFELIKERRLLLLFYALLFVLLNLLNTLLWSWQFLWKWSTLPLLFPLLSVCGLAQSDLISLAHWSHRLFLLC